MFTVSVKFLFFLFSAVLVGIVLFFRLRGEKSRSSSRPAPTVQETIRCPICGNVYAATPQDGMTTCPLCESINRVDDEPSRGLPPLV